MLQEAVELLFAAGAEQFQGLGVHEAGQEATAPLLPAGIFALERAAESAADFAVVLYTDLPPAGAAKGFKDK